MVVGERVVITDFGIARLATPEGELRASGTALIGTPAYMSPEQLRGEDPCGRADVYALGLILYELLVGEPAHPITSVYAIMSARTSGAAPDPRSKDETVPERVAATVAAALCPKREERLDARALLEAIEAMRGGGPADARRTGELPLVARTAPVLALAPVASSPGDAAGAALARDLTLALGDALGRTRGARTVSAATASAHVESSMRDGVLDPYALGSALGATLVLVGEARVSGATARVRARFVDVAARRQLWSDRIDGDANDVFALEDKVVAGVSAALDACIGATSGRRGPLDPAAREAWDAAYAAYQRFGAPSLREAIARLEEANRRFPDEPSLMGLLSNALSRLWGILGATDRSLAARAEELALRALAIDPSIAEALYTIALVRSSDAEYHAAIRALREAIERSPLYADSHTLLGRYFAETGMLSQAQNRIDVALRLEPENVAALHERVRIRAMLGDRASAADALAEIRRIAGPLGTSASAVRLAVWWKDRALAKEIADALEGTQSGPSFAMAQRAMRRLAEGQALEDAVPRFRELIEATTCRRYRAFSLVIAAEYLASMDDPSALEFVDELAAERAMIDVGWMDACPALDGLRPLGRFQRARAQIAARAAEIWR
jgi:serine/threonine-protein kinase